MRPIVAAISALSMLMLFIHGLQQQLTNTDEAVPAAANATNGTHSALNTSKEVGPDLLTIFGSGLPLLFTVVLIALVGGYLYLVGGR